MRNKNIIITKEIDCQYCYKCLRNCPVKSIRFSRGKSYVLNDDCILCGVCIDVCPQQARTYISDLPRFSEIIQKPFLVSIAPSFFAHYDEPLKVLTFLRKLGATFIQETAVGADIVSFYYRKSFHENKNKSIITTSCPVVYNLAEKYYPKVINYLAPFLSPMNVHANFMKQYVGDYPIVFIGPCIAKKLDDEKVDVVLTFEELDKFISMEKVNINLLPETYPDPPYPNRGRFYPISGGINNTVGGNWENYLVLEGIDNIVKIFENIENFKTQFFIEASACFGGCIGGPAIRKDTSLFEKRQRILEFERRLSQLSGEIVNPEEVDLQIEREFFAKSKEIHVPPEKIEEVLREMGKTSPKKHLNCGACGYSSCREKAIAVVLGNAEKEMCITYLIDKVSSISNTIIERIPNIVIIYQNNKLLYLNPKGEEFFEDKMELIDYVLEEIESGKSYIELSIDNENYVFFVKFFNLPQSHGKVALLIDVTAEKQKDERLKNLKKEALEKIEEVINRQMYLAQEISSILGESIAETKSYFLKFKNFLEEDVDL
ncbi:MAG: ferredoxin [Dictyoglomus sp. NZ13-RE01]|nr:MAG: ferredoxin [Dictyoglomus sp. NZ13-RE01]